MEVQGTPVPAPPNSQKFVHMNKNIADKLAYYVMPKLGTVADGVYAPRGWHCFALGGSSGDHLIVSPVSITTDELDSTWRGRILPLVEIDGTETDTSGRFIAAKIYARIFPKMKPYVKGVMNEKLKPQSNFIFKPYPKDHMTHMDDKLVEFETPANEDGLGTDRDWNDFQKCSLPIYGAYINRQNEGSLDGILVRLPIDMNDLRTIIIKQYEAEHQ